MEGRKDEQILFHKTIPQTSSAKDCYNYSLYCEGITLLYINGRFLPSWNRNDIRLQMALDVTPT